MENVKSRYYTILTKVGKEKLAKAQVEGRYVELTEIAVGSSEREPNEAYTRLGDEQWRGSITRLAVDKNNPNWIITELYIPADVKGPTGKGFMINEVGIFDVDGDLIVIGRQSPTYKPVLEDGTSKEIILKLIAEVGNSDVVKITVDPSTVMATKQYVDDRIQQVIVVEMEEFEKEIIRRLEELKFQVDMNTKGLQRLMIQMELDGKIVGGTGFYHDFSGNPKNMKPMNSEFIVTESIDNGSNLTVNIAHANGEFEYKEGTILTIFDDEHYEDIMVTSAINKDTKTVTIKELNNSYKKGAVITGCTYKAQFKVVNIKSELL